MVMGLCCGRSDHRIHLGCVRLAGRWVTGNTDPDGPDRWATGKLPARSDSTVNDRWAGAVTTTASTGQCSRKSPTLSTASDHSGDTGHPGLAHVHKHSWSKFLCDGLGHCRGTTTPRTPGCRRHHLVLHHLQFWINHGFARLGLWQCDRSKLAGKQFPQFRSGLVFTCLSNKPVN